MFNNISGLSCVDNEDFVSMALFLHIFSSTMYYLLVLISAVGILFNIIAMHILFTTKSMKNTFNFLLIALYSFDTTFLGSHLFLSLSLRYQRLRSSVFAVLTRVVKLIYSGAFNASILMTVGLSHERYIAMKYPLVHHQLMDSKRSRQLRFIKYLLPIIFTSCALVIPEFLDVELVWESKNMSQPLSQGINENKR